MKTAKLLLHCPDQPGILAAVDRLYNGKQGKHCLPGPVCRPCGKHFFHAFGMGIRELSYSARED